VKYGYTGNTAVASCKSQTDRRRVSNCGSKDFKRLRTEWFHSPYRSDEIEAYDETTDEVDKKATCCIVYIRNFSITGLDFAYCIRGLTNLAKFHSSVHGGKAVC
jgi:hypothetical protein